MSNPQIQLSRRGLLAGAGLTAAAYSGILAPTMAHAKAPFATTQAPYFYRFPHGKMQMTMVSDGPLPLGDPTGAFIGVPKEDVKKMLTDNFLSPDNVVLEQNSPIVNTGDKLVLFDTGMGTSKAFGPTTGRQQKSMMEAGIKPADIDAIVEQLFAITTERRMRHPVTLAVSQAAQREVFGARPAAAAQRRRK